jgi:EAL domain-containing protein (putative c-di-GMP-specific phosphodiesterase class I)
MAQKLGIPAVAKGVDSRVEWDLLTELGCEYAQGSFIAPPMDSAAYSSWLRQGKRPRLARER